MAIETIGAKHELLHEGQMARSQVEILLVSCEFSGFRKQRDRHEDRVAHLVVIRHRLLHGTGLCETGVGSLANKLQISRITSLLCELREDQVTRESQRVRARKIVASIQITSCELDDFGGLTQARLPYERHSREIR